MSTDPELSELRVQLAKMQQERDYWQAESGRFRTGLAQMQDKLVDLSEKAYIIKQKYERAKVRAVEARRRTTARDTRCFEICLSRQAQNRTLLWDVLPTSVPEFRPLSEAGGCVAIHGETLSHVGNIVLDEIIDQSRVAEVPSCLVNFSLSPLAL